MQQGRKVSGPGGAGADVYNPVQRKDPELGLQHDRRRGDFRWTRIAGGLGFAGTSETTFGGGAGRAGGGGSGGRDEHSAPGHGGQGRSRGSLQVTRGDRGRQRHTARGMLTSKACARATTTAKGAAAGLGACFPVM